jgi:hypothetical protein
MIELSLSGSRSSTFMKGTAAQVLVHRKTIHLDRVLIFEKECVCSFLPKKRLLAIAEKTSAISTIEQSCFKFVA